MLERRELGKYEGGWTVEAEISKAVVEVRKTVLLKSTLGFKRSFRYLVVST